MKKIMICLLLLAAPAYAVLNRQARIGPTAATLSAWAHAVQANTITAGATGVRNCLSNLSVTSSANFTLRILDGGTTTYAVDVATSVVTTGGGGAILNREWRDDDMCGTAATNFTVTITTQAGAGSSGTSTQKLNFSGFTY